MHHELGWPGRQVPTSPWIRDPWGEPLEAKVVCLVRENGYRLSTEHGDTLTTTGLLTSHPGNRLGTSPKAEGGVTSRACPRLSPEGWGGALGVWPAPGLVGQRGGEEGDEEMGVGDTTARQAPTASKANR